MICPRCGSPRVKPYGAAHWVCQVCDAVFPFKPDPDAVNRVRRTQT